MNATLSHLRLDRCMVIRMLGSNAPMVLPPDHGQHESTVIGYDEQQARARALRANETLILGLAIEGTDHLVIAAILGVGRQAVQKRLIAHGIARLPWAYGTSARRQNMLRARRALMQKREALST